MSFLSLSVHNTTFGHFGDEKRFSIQRLISIASQFNSPTLDWPLEVFNHYVRNWLHVTVCPLFLPLVVCTAGRRNREIPLKVKYLETCEHYDRVGTFIVQDKLEYLVRTLRYATIRRLLS